MVPLLPYHRKLALGTLGVALAVAALCGLGASLVASDKAEDSLVAQATEDTLRLLHQEGYAPDGPQATRNALAAVQALSGGYFDIAQVYTSAGLLMAEQASEQGRLIEPELPAQREHDYAMPWYERRWLPGRRAPRVPGLSAT